MYSGFFGVKLEEAARPIESYGSLLEFFTRELRPGVRRVDQGEGTAVSPVDGRIARLGVVESGQMIQAKGLDYTVSELLGSASDGEAFDGGAFVVIYLAPGDYHRIHCPFEGGVTGLVRLPGALFPVNEAAVAHIPGLFGRNERLVTWLATEFGRVAVVKVGALNVGSIRVTYDDVKTNRPFAGRLVRDYAEPHPLARGEELGRFENGSTVILLFEKGAFLFDEALHEGQKILLGEAIGRFTEKKKGT